MKAIVRDAYGPPEVLRLGEVPMPTVGDDTVLVRVHAASANAADWHLLRGTPLAFRLVAGLKTPRYRILGNDVAGTVEAVGRNVTRFRPGDEVYGEVSACGFGAYAEFVAATENVLAPKPRSLSFADAAAIPTAGCTALQALRKGGIESARTVLIHGASGGVGTFAVQIASAMGAEVTGVCSARNAATARALGAARVLDYARVDFADSGESFDLVLAVNGDRSIRDYRRVLARTGRYVMSGGSNRQLRDALLLGPLLSTGGRKLGHVMVRPDPADLRYLADLVDTGRLRPVIERRYRLSEVPDAIRYLETGHVSGKLVVAIRE